MEQLIFKKCTKLLLEDTFGLEEIEKAQFLEDWFQKSQSIQLNEIESYLMTEYQKRLAYRVDDWNEKELLEHFIGPLLSIVNFNTLKYGMFSERLLKGVINDIELSGYPDAIIAKGRRAPKNPYFCFHEYKKEIDSSGDPAGQCLAAMLVAQEINHNDIPIYGIYVVGRNWFFMVLQNKEYAISKAYQAVDNDISDILKMLKHLKTIIEEYVNK